jgi:phasin family protein
MASKGPKAGAGKPAKAPSAAPKPKRAPKQAAPKVAAPVAEQKAAPSPEPVIAEVPVTEAAVEAIEPAPVPEAAAQEDKIEAAIEAAEPVIAEAEPAEVEETPIAEVAEAAEEPVIAEVADAAEVEEPVIAEAAEVVEAIETETVEAVEATPEPRKEAIMVDAIETTLAKTQTFFADINERAKAAVEKNTKLVEEMNDFAKGNVEAIVESSKITAKGFEALGQEAADYSRKSFETATAALKSLAAVKSPTDFFKMQGDFMRQSFDSVVAEASKSTEAVLKLAGEAAQPISNRWAVAADKIKTAA